MAAPLQGPTQSGATLDTTTGQSNNWSSIISGVGGALSGWVSGRRNAEKPASQTSTTSETQPNWLWLGIAALGAVLLIILIRK